MEDIVSKSRVAMQESYSPYSGYSVGAALEASGGELYEGCNIEIANYSNTVHAEEVALSSAVADGKDEFGKIAISSRNGAPPCGMCRQTLAEFCDKDFGIIVDAVSPDKAHKFTLGELYPNMFDGGFM